ncbi:hypothetical protein BGZ95_009685 [Linnemannia exigua]|uniref:Uncharacterized protein n=1 Tax=Linnemannia exigua TaxID=604196 RepID=A0AAD4DCK4_9FUNG|nr:hypothetical protein BGZ95_009685 [Linnemannia exigua]
MHLIGGHTHPLDLPEVRSIIANFLSREDCTSCMRVNKDWFQDFAASVWHTIDFDKDYMFANLAPSIIANYAHYIRHAIAIEDLEYVSALQHKSINSLLKLEFNITFCPVALAIFFDVLRRNKSSLKILKMSGHELDAQELEDQRYDAAFFTPIDLSLDESNLTRLHLTYLCLTRQNFSDILESSPHLCMITMYRTLLVSHGAPLQLFQHYGVKSLEANLYQVFYPDNFTHPSPSLLCHFPGLETWIDPTYNLSSIPISMNAIRAEISRRCPRLSSVMFDVDSSQLGPYFTVQLLNGAFTRLKSCTLGYHALDNAMFIGILHHQETLTHVYLTMSKEMWPSSSDNNPNAKSLVNLILRSCRKLEVFSAEGHQIDITVAEEHEWVCRGLRELRVRVLQLDDTESVNDCLELLSVLRRGGQNGLSWLNFQEEFFAIRVCRRLLLMKKLRVVWLGTKDYYLASHRK